MTETRNCVLRNSSKRSYARVGPWMMRCVSVLSERDVGDIHERGARFLSGDACTQQNQIYRVFWRSRCAFSWVQPEA
jgi:hypothetical protein